jgi:UDP-N-acetylmuramoylalanine--D-glutamate ligase
MDRYESFMDYAAAKHRIFMNQTAADVAVLNADDPVVSSWAGGLRAQIEWFSVTNELERGLFLRGGKLIWRSEAGERAIIGRDEMRLRGLHNVENVLAACGAALACGAAPDSLGATVQNFQPVEHRLEFVAEINSVKFYNDSKATSVDATLKALEAFRDDKGKVVLILGGRGKQAPYAPLAEVIQEKVRKLILIGEDAPTIEVELGDLAPFEKASDMRDAVGRAFNSAEQGDTVLLAPACASFDMFESFEHRGRVFKQEVSRLLI